MAAIRFYLDENVPVVIAEQLERHRRSRRCDCLNICSGETRKLGQNPLAAVTCAQKCQNSLHSDALHVEYVPLQLVALANLMLRWHQREHETSTTTQLPANVTTSA